MKHPIHFAYRYFPVGQGLFCGGLLRRSQHPDAMFVWVYDCGTTSRQIIVRNAINDFGSWIGNRPQIDLLTLSHFDADHISGVCDLIRRFRVGTLLLPYLSLEQRLLVALAENADVDSRFLEFYIRPVEFISRIEGPGVDRVLFVRAGFEDESPPMGVPNDAPPPDRAGDTGLNFKADDRAGELAHEGLISSTTRAGRRTRVQVLARSGRLTIGSFWEFVPYNDSPPVHVSKEFRARVNAHRNTLLSATTDADLKATMTEIVATYDSEFGDSSEERNAISLFLYSGPLYDSWTDTVIFEDLPWAMHPKWPHPFFSRHAFHKCSQLFTGDGYLNTAEKTDRLMRHLQWGRMERVGAFQVMHHGAESNWHDGLAAKIGPLISIFSSDPMHKSFGHPHAAVLRDFWDYYPFQVDRKRGLILNGLLK